MGVRTRILAGAFFLLTQTSFSPHVLPLVSKTRESIASPTGSTPSPLPPIADDAPPRAYKEVRPDTGIECIVDTLALRYNAAANDLASQWDVNVLLELNQCPALADIVATMRDYPSFDGTLSAIDGFLRNVDLFIRWKGATFLTTEESPLLVAFELAGNPHNFRMHRLLTRFIETSYASHPHQNPTSYALGQLMQSSVQGMDDESRREAFLALYLDSDAPGEVGESFLRNGCAANTLRGISSQPCMDILTGSTEKPKTDTCFIAIPFR